MAVAEVKTDSDRTKTIIAIALGGLALLSLLYAFGGSFFGGSTTNTTATASPTPKRSPSPTTARNADNFRIPTQAEQDLANTAIPINYSPTRHGAPDPGRNIFAFYEPPKPCVGLGCPTPTPKPTPEPTPEPTPPIFIAYVTPQSVYAGSKSFRLDVHGDKFTEITKIYYNNSEMPTSFVNGQRLSTEIPANLIAGAGSFFIMVRTPNGVLFSNQVALNVQPPPVPTFQYIGMIARQHANNDTAYYLEQGKKDPATARLNDVIGGRFRLISIAAERIIVEDTTLGFKHPVNIQQPSQGTPTFGSGQPGGFPGPGMNRGGGYIPYTPPINTVPPGGSIPGIPDNIPRVNQPNNNVNARPPQKKDDTGDEDTDN
jgi:hypothetical protein